MLRSIMRRPAATARRPQRRAGLRAWCASASGPSSPASSPPSSSSSAPASASTKQQHPLGFGFSAGGLLFPYYVGVSGELADLGLLAADTPVAGASAGSLIAACTKSGLSYSTLLDATLQLSRDCRTKGTRFRLRRVLQSFLQDLLPDDIHHRATGTVHVAVTQVYPSLQPELLSTFTSKADLISVLLASCYIPWWFDGRLVTPVRNRLYCDGGILNFLPATPGVGRSVRVCCLPASQLPRALSTDIHPGVSLTGTTEMWPHDLSTMLGWAFQPADDHMLLALADHGREDARAWALAEGLVTPDAAAANDKQHQQQQQTKQQLQTQPLPPPPGVALGSGTVFASSNGGSPPPPAPPQPAPTSSTSSPAGASS